MTIEIKPEHNKLYPRGIPNTIEITLKNKVKYSNTVTYPKGHYLNPVSDKELKDKFHRLGQNYMTESKRKEALHKLWNLDKVKNIIDLIEIFTIE